MFSGGDVEPFREHLKSILGRDDVPHVRVPVRVDPGDGGASEEKVSHP